MGRGADGRSRTGDLCFTKALLYQLSYIGLVFKVYRCKAQPWTVPCSYAYS